MQNEKVTEKETLAGEWKELLDLLEKHNAALEERARNLSSKFWSSKLKQGNGDPSKGGCLGCRIRSRESSGAIYAEWYKTIWVKKQGAEKAKPLGQYVKKGKRDQFGYNMESLKRIAKPVEVDEVLETEKAFRLIRELNHCLIQLRKYAAQTIEVEKKWEALSEGVDGE
jgi:hypothetical protein